VAARWLRTRQVLREPLPCTQSMKVEHVFTGLNNARSLHVCINTRSFNTQRLPSILISCVYGASHTSARDRSSAGGRRCR
jgi:hypothetical protein